MHRLIRQVKFSITPFLDDLVDGYNSYSSKPSGKGLALFFYFEVEMAGEIDEATGFVVNVVDIDKAVRQFIVPLFDETIKRYYRSGVHVSMIKLYELLNISVDILTEYFSGDKIERVSIGLNPNRLISVKKNGRDNMMYFSEKFEFAAMHKLWNDEFSEDQNFRVFGKCANPAGHGHNYTAQIEVQIDDGGDEFDMANYQECIKERFVDLVDHKNLNVDVAYFKDKNPTVENIARFAWENLIGRFDGVKLSKVVIWETDKTCCSYVGEEN